MMLLDYSVRHGNDGNGKQDRYPDGGWRGNAHILIFYQIKRFA